MNGKKRKAEEEAQAKRDALQERLERVRGMLAEAKAEEQAKHEAMTAKGGPRSCSDKVFNAYANIVDRVLSLLATEHSIEAQL